MKRFRLIKIASIIAVCIIIFVVVVSIFWYSHSDKNLASEPQYFQLTNLIDYNNSLCSNTGYASMPDGFNTGIKLLTKDRYSNATIQGHATISTRYGGGGIGTDNYSCEEEIADAHASISVYAKGYTPLVLDINYPKNKLATLEVSMIKSCTGGPSFFDNLRPSYEINNNKTLLDEYIQKYNESFSDMIMADFGLNRSDYDVECIESQMERGGYVKIKGTYKDGFPFELYYHWGWCSSGGSDCGSSKCFSTTSTELFDSVKKMSCSQLSSKQNHDEYICTSEAYDNTTQVQNECQSGGFEQFSEDKKTLSVIQSSNRCASSVSVGSFDCMDN